MNVLLAQQLELEIKPSSLHLKGANGQPLINLGEVTASIVADGQAFLQTFIVVPHLESERLLLGNDFLVTSKAIIDWGTNTFQVPKPQRLSKINLIKQTHIPATSRKLVKVKFASSPQLEEEAQMEVGGTRLLFERHSVLLEPALIMPHLCARC